MTIHPLLGSILSAHRYLPRFTEPDDREPDRTGIAVEIPVDDVAIKVGHRTVAYVSGAAHVTGDGSDFKIDVIWCRDADTGALFQVRAKDGHLDALIVEAIATAASAIALERLDEAAEQ